LAYENAIAKHQRWPTAAEVAAAFEYLEYPTPSGPIKMAIGSGHQAVEAAGFGVAGDFNPGLGEVALTAVTIYPVECVNPPDQVTTEEWIRAGFPGANCP
jgi:branched-chain amino acid transport system substrate-binding protein